MGTVVSIHRVARKLGPVELLAEASFVADFGMEGDWRSRKGRGRQITLIEEEAVEHVRAQLGLERIAAGASRRQVMTRGLRLFDAIGKRLWVGEILVAVEEVCHPCENMEVQIGTGARAAMKEHCGVLGRIVRGGVVRAGDAVTIEA